MNSSETVALIVNMVAVTALVAWIAWVFLERKKVAQKSQLHHKLVDKFNTSEEMAQFFAGESGAKFLKSLAINGVASKEKLIASMTKGILLLFAGVASFLIDSMVNLEFSLFRPLGILLMFVGLGYLVATVIAYKLTQKWGIMDK